MYMNLIIVIIIIKVKSTTHTKSNRATVLSVLIIHYAGAAIG